MILSNLAVQWILLRSVLTNAVYPMIQSQLKWLTQQNGAQKDEIKAEQVVTE